MDSRTFKNDRVVARLEGYVKIKFPAENTRVPPASVMLQRFNDQPGLPAYAILWPETVSNAPASGRTLASWTSRLFDRPLRFDANCASLSSSWPGGSGSR